MKTRIDSFLIIADIEGSSGCWSYGASEYRTPEWARACVEMSRDIDAVARGLFDAGARAVMVKDFHRTAYNLLPELIDPRAKIIHGYRRGPVPGIGDIHGAGALLMVGMHAASGSGGFLAHTLTSRIARLEVNGRLLCEAELFASSAGKYGARALFLSGCPVACRQAGDVMPWIRTCSLDKSGHSKNFDYDGWRQRCAGTAVESVRNEAAVPYRPSGPFNALVTLRDGEEAAEKIARRWGIERSGDTLNLQNRDIEELYLWLIRICYFTPAIERILPLGLMLYNGMGRSGLGWVRRRVKAEGLY
jgi:D-amino peptidase